MSFPASTRALATAWADMQSLALQVRAMCETAVVDLQNPTSAQYILSIHNRLIKAQIKLAAFAGTPGLPQYVKDQLADQGVDIAAEYTAMQDAIQEVLDEITSTFPKDGNGFLLAAQFSSDGISYRTFPASGLTNLSTKLSAVVSSIG